MLDSLTHLIQLARPQVSLDVRCRLAGSFLIDHAPSEAGIASFHIVLEGSCVIASATGGNITANAGDFILFPQGEAHRITDVRKNKRKQSNIQMNLDGNLPLRQNCEGEPDVNLLCGRFVFGKGPAALLFKSLPAPLHVSLADQTSSPALQVLVNLMRDEAARQGPGSLAIMTALSHVLFVMALRVYSDQHPDTASILSVLSDARLGPSVQAMITNPAHSWTIEELGRVAAMSRATYARQFRKMAGSTAWEFLTQIRMMIASELLKNTKRNAADIGMEVGYLSEAAFGKAFQQSLGTTPGRYRRNLFADH